MVPTGSMVVAFTADRGLRVLPCNQSSIVNLLLTPMAQIIDHLPTEQSESILCCYVNATSKMQIVRITNIRDWYFERVVFPGQRLMFEAMPQAQLEIHTGMMASAILSDTIPCDRLAVDPTEQAPWEKQVTAGVENSEPAPVSAAM